MGLSASQVTFLRLTARKHDISCDLQHLSMEKMALTRDMQKVTKDYQTALSKKSLKWSNNMGVTYTDISYATLMKPNSFNAKSPILVTDTSGRVVLNNQYKKYAEMLDAAGGKWEGDIKNQILAELTGISVNDIETMNSTSDAAVNSANDYNTALEDLEKWQSVDTEKRKAGTEYVTIENLAKKLGTVNGKDLSYLYSRGENGDYYIRNASDIKSLANGIKNNMSKYFVDDDTYLHTKDKTAFEEACKTFESYYVSLIENTSEDADKYRENDGLKGDMFGWTLDMKKAFDFIMSAYLQKSGSTRPADTTQETTYPVRNTDSSAWKSWYEELKTKQEKVNTLKAEFDSSVNASNQVMTADQETMLEYYDLLFQSIADNGWTYTAEVDDNDYLNQMFQNNAYCLTTITENKCYDPDQKLSERNYKYSYDTNIASNFDKMFMVNDEDSRNDALVDYEYKKGIISAKEKRVDTRMKKLETEQTAITKMLESVDKVKNDNIERTYNLWA